MLRKINSSELKENMRFSAPVFFDDGDYMLVDEGVPIRRRELNALERWNIPFVLTAGRELAENENLEKPEEAKEANAESEFVAPSFDVSEFGKFKNFDWNEPAASDSKAIFKTAAAPETENSDKTPEKQKALSEMFSDGRIDRLSAALKNTWRHASYEALVTSLDKVFSDIKNSASVKSRAIDNIVNDLLFFVQENRARAICCIFGDDIADMEMSKNAVHTAIVSMIVAETLFVSGAGIERILAGALLHDVGMLRIPDKITDKAGKLSDGELAIIHSHPGYGYKMIVDELMYPDEVAIAAAQHHEHWDGSGYPAGLAGEKISIQARIVSAADAFVAMVSPRSYRAKFSGYEAMKNLVADNARRFDPDIVKAMIQNIGIYPVGSTVLVNNSAIAQVIQVFPGVPLRPVVKILVDENGQVFAGDESVTVDLRTNKNLFIVRDINPSEISAAAVSAGQNDSGQG